MKRNVSPSAFIRVALCCLFLAIVVSVALLRRTANTRPLAATDTVVLLLAPGSSLADWSDDVKTPTLAHLIATCPHGVFPTRTDETPETIEDPLASAARMIATGDRMPPHLPPTLAQILNRSQIQAVTLTNADAAARMIIGLSRADPLTIDQPNWRIADIGFPDGVVTDPLAFAGAISAATRASTEATSGAPDALPTPEPSAHRLVVATYDDLFRADQYAPLAQAPATQAQRAQALTRLDRVIASLTSPQSSECLAGSVALIVVSPTPSGEALDRNERLGPILFWSPAGAEQNCLLTSPSTRGTPGLLAGTDLSATIAAALGLPTSRQHIGAGRAARLIADDGRLPARLRGWDAQEGQQKLLIYVPWILAVILVTATWLARRGLRVGIIAGAAAAFFPAALLLAAGLVRTEWAPIVVYLIAGLPCIAITLFVGFTATSQNRPRYLLGFVGLFSVLILTCDVLLGGSLLARTPLSYSPMEAARFYGIGNEAAGALIGAALLAASVFLDDFPADNFAFFTFAAAVCLTIALPQLGAKAGSLIGALIGFGALHLSRQSATKRDRPSLILVAGIALGIIALTAAYAIFEGMRGAESRTHVGEAMAAAHQQGLGALVSIAKRKLTMDLHLMVTSPWAALLAVEVLMCAFVWRRKSRRWSARDRASLAAFLAAGAALLVFNDAGVVGAATCLLFAVPFALLPKRAIRAAEKESEESSEIAAT